MHNLEHQPPWLSAYGTLECRSEGCGFQSHPRQGRSFPVQTIFAQSWELVLLVQWNRPDVMTLDGWCDDPGRLMGRWNPRTKPLRGKDWDHTAMLHVFGVCLLKLPGFPNWYAQLILNYVTRSANFELRHIRSANYELRHIPSANFELRHIRPENFELRHITQLILNSVTYANFELCHIRSANFELRHIRSANFELRRISSIQTMFRIANGTACVSIFMTLYAWRAPQESNGRVDGAWSGATRPLFLAELNDSVAVTDRSAQLLGPISDDATNCPPLTVVSSDESWTLASWRTERLEMV